VNQLLALMLKPIVPAGHEITAGRIISAIIFISILIIYMFVRLFRKTHFTRHAKIILGILLDISICSFPLMFWIFLRSGSGIVIPKVVFVITSALLAFAAYIFITLFFHDIFFGIIKLIKTIISIFRKKTGSVKHRTEKYIRARNSLRTYLIVWLAFILATIAIIQAVVQPPLKIKEVDFSNGAKTEKIRIAHLSDIHVNVILGKDWFENIVTNVNAADPDLVVITGDLTDGPPAKSCQLVEPITRLKAPVMFVSGNHEILWDYKGWLEVYKKLGVAVLDGRKKIVEINGFSILVAGFADMGGGAWKFNLPPGFHDMLSDAPEVDLKILLFHRPEIFPLAAKEGYDLILAGHTHNGQTFPFNLFAKLITPYPKGFFRIGKSVLFTSPGVGFVGPPVRLFVPKEITILDIYLR